MKKESISKKLFKFYATILSLSITILSLLFVGYVVSDINNKLVSAQEQVIKNINKNIESFFNELNEFASMLINTEDFRNITISELPNAYDKGEHLGEYFMEIYMLAYKMIEKDYKLGIYTKSGHYIWLGNNYFIERTSNNNAIGDKSYEYIHIDYSKKNKYIEVSHQNAFVKDEVNKGYVSLARTMNMRNKFEASQAILEVQVAYEKLDECMHQLVGNRGDEHAKVFIYNEAGEVVYGEGDFDIEPYRIDGTIREGVFRYRGNKVYIQPIFASHLNVVSVVSTKGMYARLIGYIIGAIVFLIVLNGGLMLITYKLAMKLTSPIQEVCKQLKCIKLENKETLQLDKVDTELEELDFLAQSILSLQTQLSVSLDQIVKLEAYEMASKMLALQAQMQPHFLYNTLMTIGAMGEEQGNDEVASMCYSMTHMLRYIASEDAREVTLADEIQHVENYISIMQQRFMGLEVAYDIPLEMMGIGVPKLIIQPLVENSIKYCEHTNCCIEVSGEVSEDKWIIYIQDNGPGFTQEQLEEVCQTCEKAAKEGKRLQIKGMGVANIYTRLQLFYGQGFHFEIKSLEEGSIIEIGGTI